MIWAKEETLPRDELEALQLRKLKKTVSYIYARVSPYRKKMEKSGVRPEDIRTLDDLRRLPFTSKKDFREHYPMGLFAVDKKELVRFSRKFRHDRKTDGCRIHEKRSGYLAE